MRISATTAKLQALTIITFLSIFVAADAAIVTFTVSGTINYREGTFSDLNAGEAMNAVFKYDTDEAQATSADTAGSVEPGHEYSSFYDFASPPYGGTVTHVPSDSTFTSNIAGVVVNNNLTNGGADLNDLILSGTYDWIEILGSTTVDGPDGNPADGQEWSLALFTTDTTWITDGTLIPDDLPDSYTAILVGTEFDGSASENGVDVGTVLVDISSISVSVIPEPSQAFLFGVCALSFACRSRRRR